MIEERRMLEFLAEDLGFGDVTTEALIPEEVKARAVILAKQVGVVAGIDEVNAIFRLFNLKVRTLITDGSKVEKPGTVVMEVEGPAKFILMCERVALNILMKMSGIATLTAKFVEKARKVNPKVLVACTRKTTPGFRYFEKKAVMIGGGDTHRFRLDDMVLIKDNHIRIIGSVGKAVKKAREKVSFSKKVEVEVSSLRDALEACEAGADIIMLDNMTPNEVKHIVDELEIRGLRKQVLIEVSGGVNLDNVQTYASAGVDVISVGVLTHSAPAIDMSLEVVETW